MFSGRKMRSGGNFRRNSKENAVFAGDFFPVSTSSGTEASLSPYPHGPRKKLCARAIMNAARAFNFTVKTLHFSPAAVVFTSNATSFQAGRGGRGTPEPVFGRPSRRIRVGRPGPGPLGLTARRCRFGPARLPGNARHRQLLPPMAKQ